jgi:DNA-binding phage protein
VDHRKLARELVRALRGRRSQSALSRRLGFKTNVIYTWESGRCSPAMGDFLKFARKVGVSLDDGVVAFYRARPNWLPSGGLAEPELARALLTDQRRQVPLVQLARATGFSRFALRRWFSGEAEPRLHEYLNVLDCCSRRLIDFLATFVDPSTLPSAHEAWRVQTLARQAAYQLPWSHAVLRILETQDYKSLAGHEPGWIARRLGISAHEEQASLDLLSQSGQISLAAGRFIPIDQRAVDLRAGHAAARALSAWWVRVAAERAQTTPGMFAYNVCSISRRDLDRIQALQVDFLKQVRAIVAESEPVEQVALVAVQIFALDAPSTEPEPAAAQ